MTGKTWTIFIAICVIIFGGLIFFSQRDNIDVSNIDTNKIIAASDQNGQIGDHVFGKKDSPVMLVEYGDFQCPGCGGAYAKLKALSEKYEGQIAFVFRNFPLTTIHPNARAAAAAAEAAGLAGKYWEMHNILYENQNSWSGLSTGDRTNAFIGYAKQAGVDETTFTNNLKKAQINQKISFDQAIGKKLGVSGTPTFYLDGKEQPGDVTDDAIQNNGDLLEKAIQAELKAHNIALPK